MNKTQFVMLVMVTVVSGFCGGVFSNVVLQDGGVIAQELRQSPKIVTAEEFRLVNKDGKPRATLLLWNGDLPALTMADEECHNRVFLGVFNEAQPALLLNDKGCQQRATLDLQPHGLPALTLRDKNNHVRVRVRLLEDGSPVLSLFDKNGKESWSAPTSFSHN